MLKVKSDDTLNNTLEDRVCPFCKLTLTQIIYGRYDRIVLNGEKYIFGG